MITMEMMEEDTVVVLNEDGTEVTEQPNSPLVPLKTNNEIKITEINLEEHELEAIIDTKSPELLEYVERADSSVACKLCGEVFESKLCWYRHKYQSHIIYPANSTMVFQCEHCLVYFKTKTGYLTHIATHHSSPSGESDHLQQFNKIPPEKVEPKVTIQDLISRTNPDLVITKTNGLTCSPGCKLNAPSVPTEKVVIENSNRLMLPIRPEQAKQIIKPAETRKDHNAYTYKKPADVRPIIEATQFQIIKTTDFSIVPVPKTANCKPVDLPRKDQAVQINKPSNQRIKEQLQQIVRPTIHAEKNIKEQNQDFRPATLRNSRDPRPPELHPKDPTLQIFRPADLCTVVDQNPHSKEKIGHVTISNEQIIRKESCTNTSVPVSNNELTVKSNGLPRIEINQQQFIRAVEPRPRVEVRVKPMPDQRIKSTNAYLSRSKESKKEIIVKDEAEKKKDELFVTEIIQRVRRECEEKGIGDQPARRHSYRRTTVT